MLKDLINLKQKSLFAIHDLAGNKLLWLRLRLRFSHLNEHNILHNLNDTLTTMCDWIRN